MQRVCRRGLWILALLAALGLPGVGSGAEFDVSKFGQEVGVRFAYGKNTKKATVRLFSLLPRWGIFLIRPRQQLGPFGLSFVAEGIISVADADETGFEVGITPMLKLSALVLPSVMVYLEGGAGVISESIDTPALAHAFNFTPQLGAGFDIALTRQLALSLAYRFRHSSNAGIYKGNPAFNVNFFQAGLNYYFK